MMGIPTLVNQISLGMASVALASAPLITTPDVAISPPDLGTTHIQLVNQTTGELDQSLSFSPPPPKNLKTPVVATKIVAKSIPPESPYEDFFNQFATQFGVDVNKLKSIAWCESHYHFDSVGGNGAYGGMYQFTTSTWASTRKAMGADPNPELRFDPEQAIMTAAFKIAAGGIRAWPVCSTR